MMDENKNETEEKFEFIKEKIKERPLDKKKLLLKLIFTMAGAVVFGLIACVTFFMAKPHVEQMLYPEETKLVTIPAEEENTQGESSENTAEDVLPEPTAQPQPTPVVTTVVEKVEMEVEDYKRLFEKMLTVAKEAEKFLVTVTGVTKDVDWFQDSFENKSQTSGMIVADNGRELLVLANKSPLDSAESIRVRFCDDTIAEGTIKKYDANTGLAVIGVEFTNISEETKKAIATAQLGNTQGTSALGEPVIAVGSPLGYEDSVSYGFVTSTTSIFNMLDSDIHKITTDIYASENASGAFINLKGEVIGVISPGLSSGEGSTLLTSWSISDLKGTIVKLSNGQDIAYLGIYGTDVTEEAHTELGVPKGAYITEVKMDSPAMSQGIQSGDVIVKVGTTDIVTFDDYKNVMAKSQPGDVTVITVKRQGRTDYTDLTFEVTLEKLE